MTKQRISISDELELSRIVHGHWRLVDWNFTTQELLTFTQKLMEIGITSFDHANIYGNYSCEKLFGDAILFKKEIRKDIQIITKCGIKLVSDKYPHRKINTYDYSYEHILKSVDNSLLNLCTDYIDLLLLHRPSPLLNPEEVAKAFSHLKQSGKVLNFGVSNFTSQQFESLDASLDDKLVTNQVEISPVCLEHFENENMDFFLKEKIKPMAWSPLAGGSIHNPTTNREKRVFKTISEIAAEMDVDTIDKVIYSWLLRHPSNIIPIVGSGKFERIKLAVDSLDLEMNSEQWFRIYIASVGKDLP